MTEQGHCLQWTFSRYSILCPFFDSQVNSIQQKFKKFLELLICYLILVVDYGFQAAWDEAILEKVLRCVSDSTEKCRELAIQLIRGVAKSLPEVFNT
jgi:hypothetical protein